MSLWESISETEEPSASVSAEEESEDRTNLIAELMETSDLCIKQGRYDYLFISSDHYQGGTLTCRMIRTQYSKHGERGFDETIAITETDTVIARAVSNDGRAMELSCDFKTFSATITVEKHNFDLIQY